jgi:hypothetical protein
MWQRPGCNGESQIKSGATVQYRVGNARRASRICGDIGGYQLVRQTKEDILQRSSRDALRPTLALRYPVVKCMSRDPGPLVGRRRCSTMPTARLLIVFMPEMSIWSWLPPYLAPRFVFVCSLMVIRRAQRAALIRFYIRIGLSRCFECDEAGRADPFDRIPGEGGLEIGAEYSQRHPRSLVPQECAGSQTI